MQVALRHFLRWVVPSYCPGAALAIVTAVDWLNVAAPKLCPLTGSQERTWRRSCQASPMAPVNSLTPGQSSGSQALLLCTTEATKAPNGWREQDLAQDRFSAELDPRLQFTIIRIAVSSWRPLGLHCTRVHYTQASLHSQTLCNSVRILYREIRFHRKKPPPPIAKQCRE